MNIEIIWTKNDGYLKESSVTKLRTWLAIIEIYLVSKYANETKEVTNEKFLIMVIQVKIYQLEDKITFLI